MSRRQLRRAWLIAYGRFEDIRFNIFSAAGSRHRTGQPVPGPAAATARAVSAPRRPAIEAPHQAIALTGTVHAIPAQSRTDPNRAAFAAMLATLPPGPGRPSLVGRLRTVSRRDERQ
jgi:hypothetical protein